MRHSTQLAKRTLFVLVLGIFTLSASAAQAAFNPNKVISKADLEDYNTMSVTAIQNFLQKQGGILKNYQTKDVDGANRSAAEIIYNAAYRHQINPQYLLVRIQTESSLVTGSNANLIPWATGLGVCDSCSKSNPKVLKYKGFAKQVDGSADLMRNGYLAALYSGGSTVSGWKVGVPKTSSDGVTIIPQNNATAALYTYTPWVGYHGGNSSVGGNSLVFDLFKRFFPNRASLDIDYPNSSLLQDVHTGAVYKLEGGKLRPITSYTALLINYDTNRIIPVDSSVINRYEEGSVIAVPKFILVQDENGGIHLIDKRHKRRAITSRESFYNLGYNPEEVLPITNAELASIPEGAPITDADRYPIGGLVQNTTGAVMYYDQNNEVHEIWDRSIMETRFKGFVVHPESESFFANANSGDPIIFEDGTLVKIPYRDTIYVIDNGRKRAVPSTKMLNKLGGFESVVETTKPVLQLHETGRDFVKNSNKKKKSKKKKGKKKTKKKS